MTARRKSNAFYRETADILNPWIADAVVSVVCVGVCAVTAVPWRV